MGGGDCSPGSSPRRAPTRPRNFPENATARRNQVLGNMRDQGYITDEEYVQYGEQPIPTAKQIEPPAENSAAPYFTSWLRQQLVDRYGAGEAFGGGLQIKSTLDLEPSRTAFEEIVPVHARRDRRRPPRSSSSTTRPAASWRWSAAPTTRTHRSTWPPTATASPARRSSRSPWSPLSSRDARPSEVFTSAPQQIPFRIKVAKRNDKGDKVVNDVFASTTTTTTTSAPPRSRPATTYSDNSVYSQLGTQVGVENVAATAKKMGIETDLGSTKGYEYSIEGGPWQPYNPALILGGLETGVTSLEMAHAYNTLAADGKRLSGTMASNSGGPVGILDVMDGGDCETDCYQEGDPVADQTGASGVNKLVAKQVVDPTVAHDGQGRALDRGHLGYRATSRRPGTRPGARPGPPTTTATPGSAARRREITACVWVGYATRSPRWRPSIGGGPVDGGTFPALIFSQIVDRLRRGPGSAQGRERRVGHGFDRFHDGLLGGPVGDRLHRGGATGHGVGRAGADRTGARAERPGHPGHPGARSGRWRYRPGARRRRSQRRLIRRRPARPVPAATGARCRRRRSATAARSPW